MKKYTLVFLYFLTVRVLYVLLSGFSTCELCLDCTWINELSEKALTGNFNFDIGRFIVAPFYNVFIAGHKYLFQDYWSLALMSNQLIISSISGVCFLKLGTIIFKNEKVAFVSTIIFGIYPMTLYWVHTFCTESVFQSLLIISMYYLVKSTKSKKHSDLVASALIFSIIFLTKSHILLFTPFLAIYLYLNLASIKKISFPLIYGMICIIATLPFGLYNLKIHDQYVLSSNGSKFHFYTGNSELGYRTIVDVPEQGTEEFNHVSNMNMAYFNGDIHNVIMEKSQKQKQLEYFDMALNWIKENPIKFAKLKIYDLALFLLPGVSYRHYSFINWLCSFVVSLPIFIFGYIGLYRSIREDYKEHFFSLGLFLSMVMFSVIWYVQNRFRVITIEPIYILYSGGIILKLIEYIRSAAIQRLKLK